MNDTMKSLVLMIKKDFKLNEVFKVKERRSQADQILEESKVPSDQEVFTSSIYF